MSFYGAIPNYRQPRKLSALNNSAGLSRTFSGPARTGRLAAKLRTLVGGTRLAPKLVPSFMIVASLTKNLSSSMDEIIRKEIDDNAVIEWMQRSNQGLIIAGVSSGKGNFIVRVAMTDIGSLRVNRNAHALKALQTLSPPITDFVPRLIGHTVILGKDATIEEMVKGTTYEYLEIRKHKGLQDKINKFLDALNNGGGIPPQSPAKWMRNWLDNIRTKLSVLVEDRSIQRFYDYCLSCPDLSLLRIGRVHGDFSYRNVLFDKHTFRITGVIDWDGYIPCAPTFLDPLHWEFRGKARNPLETMALLLDRIDIFKSQGTILRADNCSAKRQWWKNSLWAHLMYGLWYDMSLSQYSPVNRLDFGAQLLSCVPEK